MPLTTSPLAVYASPIAAAQQTTLKVPWYSWDQNEWCWAACAQMLAAFYQNKVTPQCNFATQMFGHDCCQNPAAHNFPLLIDKVKEVFPLFGRSVEQQNNPVDFEVVQAEIVAGHPVQVGYNWNDGGSHLAVVAGAAVNAYGQLLWINDPDPDIGRGWRKYDDVKYAYGQGTWQWTWMPIR